MEPSRMHRRLLKPLIMAVVILAIAAAAGYLVLGHKNTSYNYRYSNLDLVELTDSAHHAGMSILKPVEFVRQAAPRPKNAKILVKPVEAQFIHALSTAGQLHAIGGLALSSTFNVALPGAAQDNKSFMYGLIANPAASGYTAAVEPMRNYANSQLNSNIAKPAYSLDFSQPKALDRFAHGWSSDFSATPKSSQDLAMKGVVIQIDGKRGRYFAVLYSAEVNWAPNQSIWQQTINSLKVDQ